MILTRGSRRVLLAACLPILLVCILSLFTREFDNFWSPFLFTLILVLCLWADGLSRPQRHQYGKRGMALSAPWLLLWLIMLTGSYFYQGPNCIIRFGSGVIEVNSGSTAAMTNMRTPVFPPRHYPIRGNWSYWYTDGWRGVGKLVLTSIRKLASAPHGTLLGHSYTTGGVPFEYHEIPVTAFLLVTGLPTLILLLGRGPKPKPGHCDQCGYDLTGNTSGVCPECGMPLPAPAADQTCDVEAV